MKRFLFELIPDRYRALSGGHKLMVWLMLATQIPLTYLMLNRLMVPFETNSAVYRSFAVMERIRLGQPMYVPLSEFQGSLTYTPLYYWVCGWIWKITGPVLWVPRLVVFLSSIAIAAAVAAMAWQRTARNLLLSLAAPCFILLTYSWDCPWMVFAYVDAPMVALAAWGFFFLQDVEKLTLRRVAIAAVLMACAFLTKQTALAFGAAAAAYVLIQKPRMFFPFILVAGAVGGGVCLQQNITSKGEFVLQCFQSAGAAPWYRQRIWNELLYPDLFGRLGMITLFGLAFVFSSGWRWNLRALATVDRVMLASGLAVALITQPKLGSGMTQAIMAYCALAICGAGGMHLLIKDARTSIPRNLVIVALLVQAAALMLPALNKYRTFLIDEHDRAKFSQISRVFQEGRTCMLWFPFLPTQLGQPETGPGGEERSMWVNGRLDYSQKPAIVNKPFEEEIYDQVIVGVFSPQEDPLVRAVLAHYTPIARIPPHPLGVDGGEMRYEFVVCRANRLMKQNPPPTAPQPKPITNSPAP